MLPLNVEELKLSQNNSWTRVSSSLMLFKRYGIPSFLLFRLSEKYNTKVYLKRRFMSQVHIK
jgi:hypothetical protein